MMEYDIHTVLDLLTLVATLWVIYELRFPLADTYQKDQDTIQSYYVVRTWPTRLMDGWMDLSHRMAAAGRPSCAACVVAPSQGSHWAVAAPHSG